VIEGNQMLIAGQQSQSVKHLSDPVEQISIETGVPTILESRTDSMLARIMGTVISSVKAGFLFLRRVFEYPINKLASL
jgi:hypothetical protein